ncbi:hypothetical protein [Helicovermis profundi]|uniref:Uncharacterized protein n=1 Tax=Helicovermis profundi TaxID=3065157 RepID=A0AAU9EMK7_9FIRM|nr:hypothetical protein HLPR_08370 [Clostridia bacterium S502]
MDLKINPINKDALKVYSNKDVKIKENKAKDILTNEVVYDKTDNVKNESTYAKIGKNNYKIDVNEIKRMQVELDSHIIKSFKLFTEDIMTSQGMGLKDALEYIMKNHSDKISNEQIEQAKEDVSEDGYFGVEQTSERILKFAKAVSGGDPSKIEILKQGFKDGFEAAKKAWGDELPDISKKTYDAVMEKFDDWENEANSSDESTN